jgi:alkylhydroperoxidase family enzyme
MTRINPVGREPEPEVAELLASMMPAGVPPIRLFRTLARNRPMTEAMHSLGGYELSRRLSISLRQREIVILRTCARCGAEYEWGVHVAFFAAKARLSPSQVQSLSDEAPTHAVWTWRERSLIRLVDELVVTNDLSDATWTELADEFTEAQLLDLVLLCGWYRAISALCRALRVDLEDDAPRFADFAPHRDRVLPRRSDVARHNHRLSESESSRRRQAGT